jgi:hypothetical protein
MSPAPGRAEEEEKEEIQLPDEQRVRDCLKGKRRRMVSLDQKVLRT